MQEAKVSDTLRRAKSSYREVLCDRTNAMTHVCLRLKVGPPDIAGGMIASLYRAMTYQSRYFCSEILPLMASLRKASSYLH
jgi:hypothetical protein